MEIQNLDIKKAFYAELNEQQRQQFAALEAKAFGREVLRRYMQHLKI